MPLLSPNRERFFWQERTSRYIARLGKELVDMLFSTDSTADVVDFSLLKWRHRDLLEMTFKSWDCSAPCYRECPLHKNMIQPPLTVVHLTASGVLPNVSILCNCREVNKMCMVIVIRRCFHYTRSKRHRPFTAENGCEGCQTRTLPRIKLH